MPESALKITTADGVIPFPEGSARFVECAIEPISTSTRFERTVNGRLVDLSDPAFRKLAVNLSAADLVVPAIGGLYVGQAATVEIPTVIRERGAVPARQAVEGSILIGNGWVEYRPVIEAMITGLSTSETEGKAAASWSIQVEEV
jgi:hypothetical protein